MTAAAHARCPVVSVPTRQAVPAHGVVTAGVHQDGGPDAVLEVAFAQAADRGASLRLLHAWRLPSTYDDLRAEDARWDRDTEACIDARAADVKKRHPEVQVGVEVHHAAPADALAGAATYSDLLVVGRHSGRMGPARLGFLARTMVAHAQCPVLVVPL